MTVDPWAGYNQGIAQLNDTFTAARAQDRQATLDVQNAAAARQQLAMGDMQLQSAQRTEQNRQDAVDAAANVKPGVRTTLYDQQGPVQPVANPQLDTRAVLAQKLASLKGQLATGPTQPLPGMPGNAQDQADTLQGQVDAIPADAQVSGAPLPQVPVQEQVPVTDADRVGAMIQSYLKNGEPEKAAALYKMVHEQAKTQGDINAVGGGSLTDFYTKVAKASLTATQSEQIEKGLTTVAALAKEGPQYLKMAEATIKMIPGFESFSADAVTVDPSKRFTSIDAGNGQTIIIDNQNPKDWKLEKKDPINGDAIFVSGYRQQHPGASDAEISKALDARKAEIAHAGRVDARTTVINNPLPAKASSNFSINGISDAEAALLQKGVAEGRIPAPNSRTAKLYVQMLKANPNLDINNANATAGALKKLEAQRSATEAFEKTASKNFDLVERLYDQNPQSTVILLNKLKNNINANIVGDPQTVMLGRALKTSLMEYAKVVTGSTGGAAASDAAQREVSSLLSQADKPETFHGSIANHRLEMQNRMGGFQDTINELRGGRGGNTRNPYPQITQYIKSNLGKVSEDAMIAAIRHSNPTITNAELKAAYEAAGGK